MKALNASSFGSAMNTLQNRLKNTNRHFAAGTPYAPGGLAVVDEHGYEVKLSNPVRGRYQFLNDGDVVFTRAESQFLKRLTSTRGASLIQQRLAGLLRQGAEAASALFRQPVSAAPVAISTGDVIIHGNASRQTVAEMKAAQKQMAYQVLREFQKLK